MISETKNVWVDDSVSEIGFLMTGGVYFYRMVVKNNTLVLPLGRVHNGWRPCYRKLGVYKIG